MGDSSVTAAALNTVNASTTVNVNATAVTTITGTASQLEATYGGGIAGLGNEAVTITDTTIDAALLITLDAHTSGIIDASTITTLTGSDADKATVRASSGITGLPGSNTLSGFTQIGFDINGEAANDHSGRSVSLSSDGSIIAIGADYSNSDRGYVRIYQNINGNWTQIGSDLSLIHI